jgi:hypothetical protein
MEALAVIESLDEVKDGLASLDPSLEAAPVDEFLFKGAPEGFHGGVVIAAGFTAPGGEGLALSQRVAKSSAGVLAAAVGMKDQLWRRLAMSLSHVPGREDQLGVAILVHRPADDPTAIEVHNAGQVKPAFLSADVGDVADPELVGSTGSGQLGQAIGGDNGTSGARFGRGIG